MAQSPVRRYSLMILLSMAALALLSLGASGSNWVSMWQGFDQLMMSVDDIEYDADEREIAVTTTFVNQSDEQLQIHVLTVGLRLSGRSISAGTDRYSRQYLEPGEPITLEITQAVPGQEAAFVEEQLDAGEGVWNLQGRVRVSVDGLSEPLWMPFARDMAIQ
ncbi:MAG: hypothetical protein WD401_02585 [Thermomicrobiaceae bacterium]